MMEESTENFYKRILKKCRRMLTRVHKRNYEQG